MRDSSLAMHRRIMLRLLLGWISRSLRLLRLRLMSGRSRIRIGRLGEKRLLCIRGKMMGWVGTGRQAMIWDLDLGNWKHSL
jgi:hypothetical protein